MYVRGLKVMRRWGSASQENSKINCASWSFARPVVKDGLRHFPRHRQDIVLERARELLLGKFLPLSETLERLAGVERFGALLESLFQ